MTADNRFAEQIQLTDDVAGLVSHVLDAVAFSSEKTIASCVLLLSTIPEYFGMVGATRNVAVSITAACVSLVVVKLALRQKPKRYKWRGRSITVPWFWVLYAAQIGAGAAFIWHSGRLIDLGLIVISLVGAVCSEQIAQVIKAEAKEMRRDQVQAAKDAIRIAELEQNAAIRIEGKRAAMTQKYAPNADGLSEEQRRRGQKNSQKSRSAKVVKRQEDLYQLLVEQYPGVELRELRWAELGRRMRVSADTAKRDVQALQAQGRVNGSVPR